MVLLWRSNLSLDQKEFIVHDEAVQKLAKKTSVNASQKSVSQR